MLKDFVQGTYGTMYFVRDMKKSAAYYTELLGKAPEFASEGWTSFDLGGSKLALHMADSTQEIDGKGILIINTKNLLATVPALKELGVEIEKDYHSVCEGGYSVDIRDPNGNRVSLFEYTGV